jgi:hypothetical protein
MQLYPGWSARDNYGYGTKKKKRKKEKTVDGGICEMRGHVSYVAQIRAEQTGGGGQGCDLISPLNLKHRR